MRNALTSCFHLNLRRVSLWLHMEVSWASDNWSLHFKVPFSTVGCITMNLVASHKWLKICHCSRNIASKWHNCLFQSSCSYSAWYVSFIGSTWTGNVEQCVISRRTLGGWTRKVIGFLQDAAIGCRLNRCYYQIFLLSLKSLHNAIILKKIAVNFWLVISRGRFM